ncbi:hypothetical protein C3489_05030 [Streptomyces sp. Ru71]|nr:hypothetical protein C3489_05030 [Streptomyces sp. Ru71]
MCARCQRFTGTPVLVHEVHAATGPGFNVYAWSECAVHYPTTTDVLDLLGPTERRSRLTLRVYRIAADGRVVDDRGKTEYLAVGHADQPVPFTSVYPPCTCPRCKAPP